jgi:DNA-binding winged helix-turn-helix (wHTH) protein/TolB-like protein
VPTELIYRFGPFEFNPQSGELRRDGARMSLEPQPARVLALLLSKPGQVVSREELQRHVWGSGTFVDFERGLAYCIAQVRGALGDSANSATYIRTLPRRGFQFLAPVHADPPGESRPAAPEPRGAGSHQVLPRALAALLLLAGGAALGAGLWRGGALGRLSARPTIRLAVAAFDNETGNPALDSASRSLSDAVVARLSELSPGRLGVIGNAAVLQRLRTFRDVKEIGRDLHADYVVLGQLQHREEKTRVIVHLIHSDDETHLWARRFDRTGADWLALQSEIAEAVAGAVRNSLLRPPSSAAPPLDS